MWRLSDFSILLGLVLLAVACEYIPSEIGGGACWYEGERFTHVLDAEQNRWTCTRSASRTKPATSATYASLNELALNHTMPALKAAIGTAT